MVFASLVAFFLILLILLTLVARLLFLRRRYRVSPPKAFHPPLQFESQTIERFRALLRIAAISHDNPADDDNTAYDQFGLYLQETFPGIAAEFEILRLSAYAWYLVWHGTDDSLAPGLLLAHYDVVAAPDDKMWRFPPFGAQEAEGAIWGRGTLDDKNSLFALLQAAEMLLKEGYRPERSLYFAFGGDEECSGTKGAAVLSEEFRSQGLTFAFALDEGAVVARNMLAGFRGSLALIGVEEKGFASIRIAVRGAVGHASMPSPAAATHRLVRALDRISRRRMPARITVGLRTFLESVAPFVALPMGLVFANLWLFAPLVKQIFARSPQTDALIRTTLAITILSGGYKDNVLPPEAEAVCNLRILPGETTEEVLASLSRLINDDQVFVEPLDPAHTFDPPAPSRTGSAAYAAIRDSLLVAFPHAIPAPFLVNVTTDSKWYTPLCDNVYRTVPMELGVEELKTIHGVNEHISRENLAAGVRFYRELMSRL